MDLIGYCKTIQKYDVLNMHDVVKFKVINYIGLHENPLKKSRSVVAKHSNGLDYIIHQCDSPLKAHNIADSLNRLMMQISGSGPKPTVDVSPQVELPKATGQS